MSHIIARANTLLWREPFATAAGILFLAMALSAPVGLALDARTIAGASVWLKPFKFQLSVGIHVLTVVLALGALERSVREGRAVKVILLVFLAMSLFEVGWITVQGARGAPSHFANNPFDLAMYVLMGIGATLIVLATALLGVLTLRYPAPEAPLLVSHAAGFGLLISGVTGLVTGWAISMNDGAIVGGTNIVGPIIPLFGWSGTAGDLRVAHFLGLHAAQFLPLIGLALNHWKAKNARLILLAASMLWLGATVALLIQALDGRPFIRLV
jgi:hypothetical protein